MVRYGSIAFMFVQLMATVTRRTCGVADVESHAPVVVLFATHSRLRLMV